VQERAVRRWAREGGHKLFGLSRDEGVSGSNGVEDRHGLGEALAVLVVGKARCPDRVPPGPARAALTVQEGILAQVWQADAEVWTRGRGQGRAG
jgi:hypothetical protein